MVKTIAILGCSDTKSKEITYARKIIEENGLNSIVIDMSVRKKITDNVDITSEDTLRRVGASWEEIVSKNKTQRITNMTTYMRQVLPQYYQEGLFQGVFSMGGAQNTLMATKAMQALPFGVPKVMLSTIVSGVRTFEPYIKTKDIILMHSVADISGLNSITKSVIRNAVCAVTGMVRYGVESQANDKLIAGMTMLGITTKGADRVKMILEEKEIEAIAFHANGVGGRAMESLIRSGFINASLDMNLHEITCEVLGGYCSGAEGRLLAGIEKEIPQVIVPGALDMIDYSTANGEAGYPVDWKERQYYYHNSGIIHMKVNAEEMKRISRVVLERLNRSISPVTVLYPEKGFCEAGGVGGELYNPEIDKIFRDEIKPFINDNIKWVDVDANINDDEFSQQVAVEFFSQLKLCEA